MQVPKRSQEKGKIKSKQTYKKNIKQNKHFRGSFHSRNHATLQREGISNCSWDQAHPSSPGQGTCPRLSTSNANSQGFIAVWFSCSCTYFSETATSSPALCPAFGVGFQAKGAPRSKLGQSKSSQPCTMLEHLGETFTKPCPAEAKSLETLKAQAAMFCS